MDPHSTKNRLLAWFVTFDLVIVNVWLGYLAFRSFQPVKTSPLPEPSQVDQCGVNCQSYIDSRISQLTGSKIITPSPTVVSTPVPTPVVIVQNVSGGKTRSTTYLPIPGSGQTSQNDWVSLAGTDFYFNPADYPGLVDVYLEANIRLFNGNGTAYFRLYDSTHGIAVTGGDIQTTSQSSTAVVSGKVSFWSGKNLIMVQAKSLTADTAIFDSGRLRIVTEN